VHPSDVDVEFWSSDSSVSSFEADELPIALPSGERKPSSEMADSLSDITHVITCLYEFSISIRNPAPRDRLEKCASIHVSHFEPFDIQHLSHKFPSAPKYLIERLGKANTRRRQLLMYHERHHDKIVGHHVSLPTASQPMLLIPKQVHDQDLKEMLADGTPPPPKSTATATTSRKTQTTVSIYVPREQDDIDACSNTDHSQTSYATSTEASSELPKLRVPPPPKQDSTFEGDPFECPYCFTIISISGRQSWEYIHHLPLSCAFKC